MKSTLNSHSEKKNTSLKKRKHSKIFNTLWIISLLAVLMVQCKKDDYEGETVGVCPEVVSTDPANGNTDVYISKMISVTFNENMNPATLNVSTFTIEHSATTKNESQLVTGIISYTGNTATFTPSELLKVNTLYTGTITTGSKDMAGNSLSKNYVWSFTTGSIPDMTPPSVVFTNPVSNATSVELSKIISVNFSKAMDQSTINSVTFSVKTGNNTVPGVVTYSGVTAVFTPTNSLIPGTIYNVIITNGVKDESGKNMVDNYAWNFTTINQSDATPPTVLSTVPVNGATGVLINSIIEANFSELIQVSTVNELTFLVKQGTQSVEGAVTYSGLTARFTPTVALLENKVYTVTITTGVKDLAGNAMVNNNTWSFTTIDQNEVIPPTVVSTDPENLAINISLNKTISADFSELLDVTTINSTSFLLFQGTTSLQGNVSYTGVTAVLNPNILLLPGTEYTVVLTNEIKDLAGNAMVSNYTWSFTTGIESNDIIPPVVVLTDPLDLATNVSLNKTITADFSEILDNQTVNESSFTLMQGTVNIEGAVSFSGVTASFNPNVDLLEGTEYTATLSTDVQDLAGNAMENEYSWTFTTGSTIVGQPTVVLGSAAAFAILAGAGVTNTGGTIVTGDLGTDPTGTVDGFPPGVVIGEIHAADPISALAKIDLTTAYNDAQGRSTGSISLPGDLSGLTLAPGLYTNSTSVMLSTGNLTLDAQGDENAVFILQMGSTLNTLPGTQVILSGGAQAANIFWSVGTSATLGTNSIFYGNILADQSISLNTGAVLYGRALTRIAAVTLQTNVVTKPE